MSQIDLSQRMWLIAQEIVHTFKNTKRKKGFLGVKLDFQKAYDRLEWNFLLAVLKAFGFCGKFIQLIHQCISTVQFTLLLNGSKVSNFCPSRGLRQGDPLSPYLFITVGEVLCRLINRETSQGCLSGVKVAGNALLISKLLHADDVIFFCKAKLSEVISLKGCIEKFCNWSGQCVSLDKSRIFWSKGVHPQFLHQIKSIWGLKKLHQKTKYLEVPLFVSSKRKEDFHYVKERLESKISSWKCKNLSWMRRATLIKFVAQAAPMYTMSTFLIPKGLCAEMDVMVRRFWWCPKKDSKKYLAPMAWSSLCKPKRDGGLGFRKFANFNLALLAKLAWWILTRKECLRIDLLIAKYKVRGNWLNQKAPQMIHGFGKV